MVTSVVLTAQFCIPRGRISMASFQSVLPALWNCQVGQFPFLVQLLCMIQVHVVSTCIFLLVWCSNAFHSSSAMVGLPAFLQSLAKYGLSQATCSAPIPPLKVCGIWFTTKFLWSNNDRTLIVILIWDLYITEWYLWSIGFPSICSSGKWNFSCNEKLTLAISVQRHKKIDKAVF